MMKAKLDMGMLGSRGIPDLHFDALVQVSSPQSQHRDAQGHVFLKADSVYILAEIGGWEVVVGVDHQLGQLSWIPPTQLGSEHCCFWCSLLSNAVRTKWFDLCFSQPSDFSNKFNLFVSTVGLSVRTQIHSCRYGDNFAKELLSTLGSFAGTIANLAPGWVN